MLFGSFSDWRKFFKDRLNIDLADLASYWGATQEIFQRRHVIVHNGGRASRRYVEWAEKNRTDLKVGIGESLDCDEAYMYKAISHLLVLGCLLATSVSLKFERRGERSILDILQDISYQSLVAEHWDVANPLCAFGESRAGTLQDQMLFRVNRMIAESHLYGFEHVRKEVSAWDVSALEGKFKFAKICLLRQFDDAFPLLKDLVAAGEVTQEDLLEWPLLEEMREDDRFRQVAASGDAPPVEMWKMTPASRTYHRLDCGRAPAAAEEVDGQKVAECRAKPCKVCNPSMSRGASYLT